MYLGVCYSDLHDKARKKVVEMAKEKEILQKHPTDKWDKALWSIERGKRKKDLKNQTRLTMEIFFHTWSKELAIGDKLFITLKMPSFK